MTKDEANLFKSQISRWYVNGFTDTYNGCRRNDLKHPLEHHDYLTLAKKFKPVEDLDSGNWNKDKFRKYTISLGRYEGILFYIAERETTLSTKDSPKDKAKAPIDVENNTPEEKAAQIQHQKLISRQCPAINRQGMMAQIYSVYIVSFEKAKSLPMPMRIYLSNMSLTHISLLFI